MKLNQNQIKIAINYLEQIMNISYEKLQENFDENDIRINKLSKEAIDILKYKINQKVQKIILRDILKDLLPGNLYNRPKHGFEIPLLKWFRRELKGMITKDLLEDDFIADQGIFDVQSIRKLKKRLFSSNPGDVHAHIWALMVFQSWWKKYLP